MKKGNNIGGNIYGNVLGSRIRALRTGDIKEKALIFTIKLLVWWCWGAVENERRELSDWRKRGGYSFLGDCGKDILKFWGRLLEGLEGYENFLFFDTSEEEFLLTFCFLQTLKICDFSDWLFWMWSQIWKIKFTSNAVKGENLPNHLELSDWSFFGTLSRNSKSKIKNQVAKFWKFVFQFVINGFKNLKISIYIGGSRQPWAIFQFLFFLALL